MTTPILPCLPGQVFVYEFSEEGANGGRMFVRRMSFDKFVCFCDVFQSSRDLTGEAAVLDHIGKWCFDTVVWAYDVDQPQ